MFTLRVIEETRESKNSPFQQVIRNYSLGNNYCLFSKGLTKVFDEIVTSDYPDEDTSKIRAIVIGGNELTILIRVSFENERFSYFIMTENGKTLEKL